MGEGGGERSGKWMPATLGFAVPRWGLFSIILWISEALLGWGGEGGKEWEVDARNFRFCCSAVGPVLDNCGFLRPPWDGGGRGGEEWEVDARNFRFCCSAVEACSRQL